MNTLYTITINSRKYVTTDKDEMSAFSDFWNYHGWIVMAQLTPESIPYIMAI